MGGEEASQTLQFLRACRKRIPRNRVYWNRRRRPKVFWDFPPEARQSHENYNKPPLATHPGGPGVGRQRRFIMISLVCSGLGEKITKQLFTRRSHLWPSPKPGGQPPRLGSTRVLGTPGPRHSRDAGAPRNLPGPKRGPVGEYLRSLGVPKHYKFMGCDDIHGPEHYKFIGFAISGLGYQVCPSGSRAEPSQMQPGPGYTRPEPGCTRDLGAGRQSQGPPDATRELRR